MTTLKEYIKVQGGYAYKSKDFIESSENKVLKIKNVRFGTVDYAEPAYVSDEIAASTKNWKVKEGDVLISMTGSGPNAPQSLVGRVARVWKNEPDAWINQRVGRVCLLDENSVHLDFIFYWLSLPQSQDYLVSNSSGSANQANISGKIIESLPCPKVDYQTSKQIADLARNFDEKVILNSQTNQTLEQMAQAIFKSWFVDFEPVKAKMNGEQPDGMDEATASLFPEKLVESELGLIPEGWEIKPIKDLCSKVQNGGTPKRSESLYWDDGDIPWLTSGEVRQSIITSVENRITQLGLDKSSAKWVPELSTLVALYGATAGEVSLTSIPLTTNQAVCALMPKKEHQWYNYLQLKSRVAELAGKAVGSAQQNISKGLVESTEVLSVPEPLLEAFNAQVENLFKLRICNLKENVELAKLRDTLLPKLLWV